MLFKESGTGLLGYMGEVCHKVHSVTLGKDIWPEQASTPWEYIYFLKDVTNIDLDFGLFKKKLNYDSKYHLQGAISLNEDRWSIIRKKYGNFEKFLKSFGSHPAPLFTPEKIIRRPKGLAPSNKELDRYPDSNRQLDKDLFKKLLNLDDQIELLKKDPAHMERAHESLVESFFKILGYSPYTDIKHRQGRVDITVQSSGKILIVVEVKKDWNLNRQDIKVVRQAYNYALETGAKYVIITNGDYYAVFDQDRGRSYDDMLVGEFWISVVPPSPETIEILNTLQKKSSI